MPWSCWMMKYMSYITFNRLSAVRYALLVKVVSITMGFGICAFIPQGKFIYNWNMANSHPFVSQSIFLSIYLSVVSLSLYIYISLSICQYVCCIVCFICSYVCMFCVLINIWRKVTYLSPSRKNCRCGWR